MWSAHITLMISLGYSDDVLEEEFESQLPFRISLDLFLILHRELQETSDHKRRKLPRLLHLASSLSCFLSSFI